MKAAFSLSLAVIVYTYIGYPILIALMSRFAGHRHHREPWMAATEAPISIVMAVHNGGPVLESKIDHLLTIDRELVKEVIIVSDGSTDETNAQLGSSASPRLKVIVLPRQVGKAAALNRGIDAASAEILVFVDIRPRIAPGALASLLANFADASVGCVAGELILQLDGHDGTMKAVSGLYWKYEQWIRNCEAAWDSPVGVYGGFYAVRRSAAVLMPAGIILDDMFQPLSIIRAGYRSVLDRSACVFDIWPTSAAGEFERKVRTLAGNFQLVAWVPWIMNPRKNRVFFQFFSHKLLRLVVPYCFMLLLLSSAVLAAHSSLFALVATVQLLFWTGALVSLRVKLPTVHRLGVPASALLMLNAAAVVGLYKFLFTRGPLWKIWSPAAAVHPASTS